MCGIAGAYSFEKRFDPALLEKATKAVAHRGPDGLKAWICGAYLASPIVNWYNRRRRQLNSEQGQRIITFTRS